MKALASGPSLCVAVASILILGNPAFAQSQPSAKTTAQVGSISVVSGPSTSAVDPAEGPWTTIMANTIKCSNQKAVYVDVSLECGLYTRTLTRSKNATSDTSGASAGIQVRVLVDGVEAAPGAVVFARRSQELTAKFQGILDGCLTVDPLTGAVVIDETCVEPEELELILDTMSAHSFNFLAQVPVGVHTIEIQARIDLGQRYQAGSAEAKATIGKGSFTVEEVRLVKGEDIVID